MTEPQIVSLQQQEKKEMPKIEPKKKQAKKVETKQVTQASKVQQETPKRILCPYINKLIPHSRLKELDHSKLCKNEVVYLKPDGYLIERVCLDSNCECDHFLQVPKCQEGEQCYKYHTDQYHYVTVSHPVKKLRKQTLCNKDEECVDYTCNRIHGPKRKKVCSNPFTCAGYFDRTCKCIHDIKSMCIYGNQCRKQYEGCRYTHPPPCNNGERCNIRGCPFTH